MAREKTITLEINGRRETATIPSHRTLLEALRGMGHVEVKSGCEKGDCGACAVLVDGVAVDSCLTLAWTVEGRAITTIAGLGDVDSPHPLQQSFADSGAAQCGYCTPGLIVAAQSMLNDNPDPDEDDIRLALSGNLCRCTGYTKVFEAIEQAASAMKTAGGES